MTQKKIQKVFYFSSEYAKKFIENRLDDLADKTKRSTSFIIESLLLDGLLPKNSDAKDLVRLNLYKDDAHGGVEQTLLALFEYNSGGTNWKSKHNNFRPIIEYCIRYSKANSKKKNEHPEMYYCRSKFESIIDRIEACTESCIEPYDREMYKKQLQLAKKLLEMFDAKPAQIDIKQHFQLIFDCFDMLDDWQITYRYLYELVSLCEWQEDSNARNALYDIISVISEAW